ncbi:MAG: hypothetical protein SFW36_03295 [Leptolyngbyaceae cyanobacterium bins.59]|nr:hypothetical protein [Leptolyngbyaceae cyanobacterium bins.59]
MTDEDLSYPNPIKPNLLPSNEFQRWLLKRGISQEMYDRLPAEERISLYQQAMKERYR